MEQVKFVGRFDHNQFAGLRNAIKPAIDPYRGTKVVPADPFLVTNFPGVCDQATEDAAVAPKPDKAALGDAGGNVGGRSFDLISELRFVTRASPPGVYGRDDVAAAAAAARA